MKSNMYFSRFSDKYVFLKAGKNPPQEGGILAGIQNAHTVCLNPAIFPNKELIWYMVNLQGGQPIQWLNRNRILEEQLNIRLPFHQIDFDTLKQETRRWNRLTPIPDDFYQNINPNLSHFFYNEEDDYAGSLRSFEWQEKRMSIFEKNGYKCANPRCKVSATLTLVMGKGESALKHYRISDFLNTYQNNGDLRWRSMQAAMKFFNSLKIPFITITNFLYKSTVPTRIVLELHHKYYIRGRKPWEYDDACFVPLCHKCHKEVHRTEEIPVYEDNDDNDLFNAVIVECDQCNGNGYIERVDQDDEYGRQNQNDAGLSGHDQNGICFKCWGDGFTYR